MQKHQCDTQKSKRVYLAVSQTSAVWFPKREQLETSAKQLQY